jgi:hypothetical protein
MYFISAQVAVVVKINALITLILIIKPTKCTNFSNLFLE